MTTTTNALTAMQDSVVRSFPEQGSATITELAHFSDLTNKQVHGVLNGLIKRELVAGDATVGYTLTEAGLAALCAAIDATPVEVEIAPLQLHDVEAESAHIDPKVEQLPDEPVAPAAPNFAAMFEARGGNEKGKMYKVQKAVAAAWTGTREDFVAQSIAYGIIRRTTVINWKEGREGK